MALDEQTRLLTLAHLHNGERPADAAELTGVSYATALKLRKELHAAEEKDRILELFELDKAALNILLESVKNQMKPVIEAFNGQELVEAEVEALEEGISGAKILDKEFQNSASVISGRITQIALTANSADTILALSKALCELQNAFFKPDAASPQNLPMSSFESFLKD